MGFSKFITSTEWDEYIKNPFDTTARENYLQHVSVVRDPKKSRNKKLYPPYGLTFASFTTNVGVVEVKEKQRKINAGHVNAYLIMPGIVYHLSATLKKGNIHEYVGKKQRNATHSISLSIWICNKKSTNGYASCRTYKLLSRNQ